MNRPALTLLPHFAVSPLAPALGQVTCVHSDECTDPAFQVGQVYDLLEIVRYGSVVFYRVGIRGLWGALSLAYDFERLHRRTATADATDQLATSLVFDRAS